MKATIHKEVREYIECPHCGDNRIFYISHMLHENKHWTNKFGPWYCDKCGGSIQGEVLENGDVEIEPLERTKQDTYVLLEFPPDKESIYLIVKGMAFDGQIGNGDEYYYNEHTCPINYFRDAKAICVGDDSDPHGLFKYHATISKSSNEDVEELTGVEAILNHFKQGKEK